MCNGACNVSLVPLSYDSAGEKLCSLNDLWNDKVMICHGLSCPPVSEAGGGAQLCLLDHGCKREVMSRFVAI